jgi:hypothetical protein
VATPLQSRGLQVVIHECDSPQAQTRNLPSAQSESRVRLAWRKRENEVLEMRALPRLICSEAIRTPYRQNKHYFSADISSFHPNLQTLQIHSRNARCQLRLPLSPKNVKFASYEWPNRVFCQALHTSGSSHGQGQAQ